MGVHIPSGDPNPRLKAEAFQMIAPELRGQDRTFGAELLKAHVSVSAGLLAQALGATSAAAMLRTMADGMDPPAPVAARAPVAAKAPKPAVDAEALAALDRIAAALRAARAVFDQVEALRRGKGPIPFVGRAHRQAAFALDKHLPRVRASARRAGVRP